MYTTRALYSIPAGTPRDQITSKQYAASLALMVSPGAARVLCCNAPLTRAQTPFYYAILLLVGTAFGRLHYFKGMAVRPFTRLAGLVRKKQ